MQATKFIGWRGTEYTISADSYPVMQDVVLRAIQRTGSESVSHVIERLREARPTIAGRTVRFVLPGLRCDQEKLLELLGFELVQIPTKGNGFQTVRKTLVTL